MGLDISSQATLCRGLKEHVGHRIECVTYGEHDIVWNISLECETCAEVLLDAEISSEMAAELELKGECHWHPGQACSEAEKGVL